MKKLLKIVICGTHEQCTDALFSVEKSNVAVERKKKSERTAFSPIQIGTKCKWCEKIYMAYRNFQV